SAGHRQPLGAGGPLRSAQPAPEGVGLVAAGEVGWAAVREALPWAAAREVRTLAVADRRGHHAVVAALVRQRNTKRKPTSRRIIYKVGLSSHTLFSSQAINSSRSATTS